MPPSVNITDVPMLLPRKGEKDIKKAKKADKAQEKYWKNLAKDIHKLPSDMALHAEGVQERLNEQIFHAVKQQADTKKFQDLLKPFLDTASVKDQKLKRKITEETFKAVGKGGFFPWLKKSLPKITQLLSSSWIITAIKFLLAMAIFDPKGKILGMIVNFLLKAVNWVIDILVKNMPWIVENMVNLITNVLPKILWTLASGLFMAFTKLLTAGWDKVDGVGSLIKFIINKIISFGVILWGLNTILSKFGINILSIKSMLIKFLPWLGKFLIQSLIKIVFNFIPTLMNLVGTIFGILTAPITWIIAAITGAIALIWIFRDNIVNFFNSIDKYIAKILKRGGIFNIILAAILMAFTKLAWPIKALAKLFQLMSKIKWKVVFADLWKMVKDFGKAFGNALLTFIKMIPDLLIKGFRFIFIEVPRKLGNFIIDLFTPLKGFWDDIINWIDSISRIGLYDYLTLGESGRAAYSNINKNLRTIEKAKELGIDTSKSKSLAKYEAAIKDEGALKDLIKEISKGKEDKSIVTEITKLTEKITKQEEKRVTGSKGVVVLNSNSANAR